MNLNASPRQERTQRLGERERSGLRGPIGRKNRHRGQRADRHHVHDRSVGWDATISVDLQLTEQV